MYLSKEYLDSAANFINSPLWKDIKRCLLDRRPESPQASDAIHTAAAKGFERKGYEQVISEIEKLPFDAPSVISNPFERPSITETRD